MKSSAHPHLSRKFALLVHATMIAIPSVVDGAVQLAGNNWFATIAGEAVPGGPNSVVITGTLTTNGLITANELVTNGTHNANILNANTLSAGAFSVSGASNLTGNTSIAGDLSVYKGFDLGKAASNSALSALQIDYYNVSPSLKTASFDLTDVSANFRWQDNITGTARPKMKLDGSNVLTLYNNSGIAAVTINPTTGKIELSGASGAGIYSNNVPVLAVGSSGATRVSSSSLAISGNSSTGSLNVTGSISMASLTASGAATVNSLTVSGNAISSTLKVNNTATMNTIIASGGVTVAGTTRLNGAVVLAQAQGDISMGDYAE